MADKTAGKGSSGNKVSPGNKPDSPDQTTADQAQSRDSAGQRDKADSADEMQPNFREALERKRARKAGTVGAPLGKYPGKIHGTRGPATNRRTFRRKSG